MPSVPAQRNAQTTLTEGFTVVELIVVMVLTMLFSGMVITFAIDFWGSEASLQNSTETLVTRQNAGDILRTNLERAQGLIEQNSIPDSNTEVSDPSNASGTYWLTLHAVPTTITMPAANAAAPVFYFTSPSTDTSHNLIMNGAQPYYDEFVLYMDGTTKRLLLRTLVNPNANGDRLQTTCPEAIASSTCPGDRIVADDVASVSTKYFSKSGNSIDHDSIVDPNTGAYIGPDFPAVEVVEITVNIARKAVIHGTNDTTNSTTIRVAFRNG